MPLNVPANYYYNFVDTLMVHSGCRCRTHHRRLYIHTPMHGIHAPPFLAQTPGKSNRDPTATPPPPTELRSIFSQSSKHLNWKFKTLKFLSLRVARVASSNLSRRTLIRKWIKKWTRNKFCLISIRKFLPVEFGAKKILKGFSGNRFNAVAKSKLFAAK